MSLASFAQDVLTFVQTHSAWAGPVLFVLAFCESLAVVSVVVPATAIIAGSGALLGAGALHWTVLLWAAAGASLGDAVSYWVGQWLGPHARHVWPFRKDPQLFDRAHDLFVRYGVFAIFIGRFFGPLRAIVPLAAGVLDMPQMRFQIANVLSALVWAPAVMTPGAILGVSLEALSAEYGGILLVVFILGGLLFGGIAIARFMRSSRRPGPGADGRPPDRAPDRAP